MTKSSVGTLFEAASQQVDESIPVPNASQLADLVMEFTSKIWKKNRKDVTPDALGLLYRVVRSQNDVVRVSLMKEIVTSKKSISLSEKLLVELLRHAELWPSETKARRDSRYTFRHDQLLQDADLEECQRLWLKTAWSVGIAAIYKDEPLPTSIAFRLAQLTAPEARGYEAVQDAMRIYLADMEGLVRFVSEFSAAYRGMSYSIEGVDRLVPDWRAFLDRASMLSEPADAVEVFREALDRLKNSDMGAEVVDEP